MRYMLYSLSEATQALKSGSFCYGFLILYSYKILVSSLLVCLFVLPHMVILVPLDLST